MQGQLDLSFGQVKQEPRTSEVQNFFSTPACFKTQEPPKPYQVKCEQCIEPAGEGGGASCHSA